MFDNEDNEDNDKENKDPQTPKKKKGKKIDDPDEFTDKFSTPKKNVLTRKKLEETGPPPAPGNGKMAEWQHKVLEPRRFFEASKEKYMSIQVRKKKSAGENDFWGSGKCGQEYNQYNEGINDYDTDDNDDNMDCSDGEKVFFNGK